MAPKPNTKTYSDPVPKNPEETAAHILPSGETRYYCIWTDITTNVELIQCDLCNTFVPLTSKRTTAQLQKHRNSNVCQRTLKKMTPEVPRPLVFENIFQDIGPSKEHSPVTESAMSTPTVASFTPSIFQNTRWLKPTPTTPTSSLLPAMSTGYSSPLPHSSPVPSLYSYPPEDSLLTHLMTPDWDDNIDMLCKGQVVEWTAGSVWETYNFQQHDNDNIKWMPIGYEGPRRIRLQSKMCGIYLTPSQRIIGQTCPQCATLLNSRALTEFMNRAASLESVPHTPWMYLNFRQLKNLLVSAKKRTNKYKLQYLNASRRIGCLSKKLNDYQRMVMMISQNKIAGVSRILAAALRNGASAEAICIKLNRAIEGTYSLPSGNWTQREIDVAFLVKALGGPRLLYALQKAEGYPSLSSLRRRKPIPELTISTSIPSTEDFNENIEAFLGPNGRQRDASVSHLPGQVVVMDGASIEEAVRFDFKHTSLVGLCREHSQGIKTTVNSIDDVNNIVAALQTDKTCHYGKDATLVGIAPLTAQDNYHVTPLILSASCKAEKGDQMAKWIRVFIDTYRKHPFGEKTHGPITTLATDGEASFRRLRFLVGLSEKLDQSTNLGRILYRLPGLNLHTGKYGLLTTCDPKHIIKRFATMLRSSTGIQVGGTHVTSENTLQSLQLLPGMTVEKARMLLNPADKQNVPKAVNLLQSLQDLQTVDATSSPSQMERTRSIVFISEVLSYFLLPFIKVELSLSEQISSLSTYAHLITALYWRHGLAFMSSALYADSQAIVKNILFNVARLQILDPTTHYWIFFEGTDRLENLFSHVRTQDHSRNFDIQAFKYKLDIAAELDVIFQRHPDLDRGHIRRNLVGARGVDRINPKSWVGDVVVGNVDIEAEYVAGRDRANDILLRHFNDQSAIVNFMAKFRNPSVDHLRPSGDYIGTRGTADEDYQEEDTPSNQQSASTGANQPDNHNDDARLDPNPDDANGDEVPDKDLINPPPAKNEHHYLTIDGKRQYIPTIVNSLFGTDRERKALVTTRALRVQGLTIEKALRKNLLNSSGDNLDTSESHLKAGDLGALLVRVGDMICLAVAEVLNFRQGTSTMNLSEINMDDLDSDGSKSTTIAIQILQLVSSDKESLETLTWWWPQAYIQFSDPTGDGGPLSQRHLVTRISGKAFYPLSPSIIYSSGEIKRPIWSLSHGDLEKTLALAWSDMDPESTSRISDRIKKLPEISGQGSTMLPYRLLEDRDKWLLYIAREKVPVPVQVVKLLSNDEKPCRLCGVTVRIGDMRNHVGSHILRAQRNVPDPQLSEGLEIGMYPCGWCGLADAGCNTHIAITSKTTKITSDCIYHYQGMQYKRASISSMNSPCTNVPVQCPLCAASPDSEQTTFWKYNFILHMAEYHLDEDNELPFVPLQLWATTHITTWEEERMGVPREDTKRWRDQFQVFDSDDVDFIQQETQPGEAYYDHYEHDAGEDDGDNDDDTFRSRKRAISVATTGSDSRNRSPKKKQHTST